MPSKGDAHHPSLHSQIILVTSSDDTYSNYYLVSINKYSTLKSFLISSRRDTMLFLNSLSYDLSDYTNIDYLLFHC